MHVYMHNVMHSAYFIAIKIRKTDTNFFGISHKTDSMRRLRHSLNAHLEDARWVTGPVTPGHKVGRVSAGQVGPRDTELEGLPSHGRVRRCGVRCGAYVAGRRQRGQSPFESIIRV